jgi:hypothetical protein
MDRDREDHVERRRRTWTGGVVRSFAEMEEADLDWWMAATPAQRIRGLTELMAEMRWMGGERGPLPRLQRTVGGTRPRKG